MNRPAESSSRQEKVKPKKVNRFANLLRDYRLDSQAKFSKAARAARPRPTKINMMGRHTNPWTTRVHDSSSSSSSSSSDSSSSSSSSSSDSSSSSSSSSDSSSSSSDSNSSSSNNSDSSNSSSSSSDRSNSSSSNSNRSSSSNSSNSSDSSSSSDSSFSSSSSSSNENDITHRRATELARPEASPLKTPSRPAPAYYTPPPTAQARARSRLGYTGAKSALPPNTLSPLGLGGGTAGTGIRQPPGYGLDSVHNNNIDKPAPAIVPAVARPPPYILHARDRFLETNLAATFDRPTSRSSPRPPPPAYGVAPPPIELLDLGDTTTTTSGNRNTGTITPRPPPPAYNIRGLRRPRSTRSVDSVDWMIDLERGTRLRNETGAEDWTRGMQPLFVWWYILVIVFVIGTIVALTCLINRV